MKIKNLFIIGLVLSVFLTSAGFCHAQGTAFTYQGSLSDSNGPANGSYDLKFQLFNASSGGSQVGSTINDPATGVSNGLFTVILDFGTVFSGADTWLQIGVRSNGVGSFETLSPRQELTPSPYSITSENLDGSLPATQLTGTLPAGLLSGTYGDALTLNNAGNSFTGNGSGLTGVNASQLGGLGPNNFWQTTGNSGTIPGVNFVGTTDGASLELSAPFVGVNRTTPVTGADVFSVTSPATNGSYGGMYVDTGVGGLPFYGYSLAGSDVAWTFIDGSFFNSWFLYNDGYVLTATTNGMVGIENTFPEAPLDVTSGNHWDVFNQGTAGDFRISGGVGSLKIGVATGGAGGGDARIFAYGGTSRLILGSSNYDGVIVVSNNIVGINTFTPNINTSLDVEGAATDGIYINNSAIAGNAIESITSGDNGYALWGKSYGPTGVGVVGNGNGSGNSATIGVSGSTSDTNGTGVQALSAAVNSPALTINSGTFRVAGAGLETSTTAFIHTADTNNDYITTISNPVCDGDPNAILIVTHNYNSPVGAPYSYETHPYSVWYDGSNWTIYNDDFASIANMTFNILVIKN
jgi:hypothetical protein